MRATRRPFRTRFRFGSTYRLNLATHIKSPIHDAKGTQSGIALTGHSPPTACRRTVSGLLTPLTGVLFTFPSRY